MKQQDRLEEREQDIEEQLYKLESDKRLVEVTGASPCCGQPWGLSLHEVMGIGFWGRRPGGQGGRRTCKGGVVGQSCCLRSSLDSHPFVGGNVFGAALQPHGSQGELGGEEQGCP